MDVCGRGRKVETYREERSNLNVHLIKLSGSDYDMARTHGTMARNHNALAPLLFYGNFVDAALAFQASPGVDQWRREKAKAFVEKVLEPQISAQIPSNYRQVIEGICDGAKISHRLGYRSFCMPDMYQYLLARRYYFWKGPRALHQMGCSSFVSKGNPPHFPFLHGRNLDFPGGFRWTDHAAVLEYEPQRGQRYAAVSSLGIHTAGITGMNESGLSLGLHMNYSKSVQLRGVPITIVGNEVLRKAQNLDDAAKLIRSFEYCAGWTIVLSSHRERSALLAQCDASGVFIKRMGSAPLHCTNFFLDPEMAKRQFWITQGRSIDSFSRFKALEHQLNRTTNGISVSNATAILGNTIDPHTKQERAYGSTLCQPHTTTSVVFEPSERRIWVAEGRAPHSRRAYHPIEVFPGPFRKDGKIPETYFGAKDVAREEYGLAHDEYFPGNRLKKVQECLERAVDKAVEESLYLFMLGMVLTKRGKVKEAIPIFERALQNAGSAYEKATIHLNFGRILDLDGRRDDAIQAYRKTIELFPEQESELHQAARAGVSSRWTWKMNHKLYLDFTIGDVVQT